MSGGTSLDIVPGDVARQAAGTAVSGNPGSEAVEYDLLRVVIWSLMAVRAMYQVLHPIGGVSASWSPTTMRNFL